ncbi:branched-chain amino acid ABC transporter permease [Rhodoligotrophos defluvii]|uniref:branched-chain amino acid ABC transporter permease n=1 Tax=Rhodoligotrophos defluvii TaxID=2561934 RepID=UPI0010C9FC90|nr:branched-chain amino acid ABC transporter permease [Rhodoligotrophos defluvii]
MQLFIQTVIDGISTGAIIALVAVGLSLVFRISRFVNVAHVDLATIGAYVTLLFASSLATPFPLAALIGIAAVAATGFGAYKLVYRRLRSERAITLIIASVGVSFFLRYLVTFIWSSNQQAFDLPLLRAYRFAGFRISPYDLMIILATLAVFAALHITLRYTAFGRSLRAVSDNPSLARVAGVASERVVSLMWLIGAGLAGLGGILLGIKAVLTPYLGWQLLLPAFAAVILGGVGSVTGTLAGALIIGIVGELAAIYWLPTYRVAAVFAMIVLVLLIRPQGLFGAKAVAK